ncbi:MAG TPA: class I SAM-dependent methyltransferase [Paludibacter sp.]|nr:class I SAM-dependent methyltransferase [Paludibacter sp.]
MKIRDSGMPEETMWSTFFDPEIILQQMEVSPDLHSIVDLGCGFGTFSIPASQLVKGTVHAFDIDEVMIQLLKDKIDRQNISNIELHLHDFIAQGSGLPDNSVDYVMLFNILHHDHPTSILNEVHRIVKPGKSAGIVHWRSDIPTPRGPKPDIRPTPEQCKQWAIASGFIVQKEVLLGPYHFGIIISKLK